VLGAALAIDRWLATEAMAEVVCEVPGANRAGGSIGVLTAEDTRRRIAYYLSYPFFLVSR